MVTRELDKFQIQLVDTVTIESCAKCAESILVQDDPEHIILWPAKSTDQWHMHILCYGDVIGGMIAFFKQFIEKESKSKVIH